MSYNPQNYAKVKEQFRKKRAIAQEKAQNRLAKLHAEIPALAQLDATLQQTAARTVEIVLSRQNVEQRMKALKEENLRLQKQRCDLLAHNGYAPNYTDIIYECQTCEDTGAVGTKMCACMRRALILCGYESSGLGTLLQTQSFDNFEFVYYANDAQALQAAQLVYQKAKEYATSFTAQTKENLLFCGKTGLGKTHLCTSIAKVVIDGGFDVVYETAQDLFFTMQQDFFQHDENASARVRRYFECDLLILDDLGTELTGAQTVSFLYNIINTRINMGKPMIVNTNLTQTELGARYADRITSRLFGNFSPFLFLGTDIRAQKR